jgi:malonyl CoA-acyl carrier protein transacylase
VPSDGVAAFAGHSLGEIAALTAAGAIGVDDGLDLVCLRGRLMQRSPAAGAGRGMMALVGAGVPDAEPLLRESGAVLVNDNGTQQIVVSGDRASLERLAGLVDGRPLKALTLPVSGAFHTEALRPEAGELASALQAVEVRPPVAPVWSSMLAAPFTDVRRQLPAAMARPVRWRETVAALLAGGVSRVVDVGPGKVLARLMARDHGARVEIRSVELEEETHAG